MARGRDLPASWGTGARRRICRRAVVARAGYSTDSSIFFTSGFAVPRKGGQTGEGVPGLVCRAFLLLLLGCERRARAREIAFSWGLWDFPGG